MKKNIIVLGDSFTYGQGCSDKDFYYDSELKRNVGDRVDFYKGPSNYCWASLLQRLYTNYNVINLAEPGNDNSYMLVNAYKHADENTSLIIFSGTMTDRMHVYDMLSGDVATWVMAVTSDEVPALEDYGTAIDSKGYEELKLSYLAKKYFMKYLYTEKMFSVYALNALYAACGLAQRYNAKFIWSGYPHKDHLHEEYTNKLIDMKIVPATFCSQSVYRSKDKHLNNLGHELYFNTILLPKIKEILE